MAATGLSKGWTPAPPRSCATSRAAGCCPNLNEHCHVAHCYPSLRNKRVVVTGGGSSIGAAIVESFAYQGAHVAPWTLRRLSPATSNGVSPTARPGRATMRAI